MNPTKVFNSIAHFFAWVADKLLPKAVSVATDIEQVLSQPATEALLQLAGTQGATYLDKSNAIMGALLAGLSDAAKAGLSVEQAVASWGLNGAFDTAAIAALKAVWSDISTALGSQPVTVPVKVQVTK